MLKLGSGSGEEAVFDVERQNKASRHFLKTISRILAAAIRHVKWFGVIVVISREHQIDFK